MNDNDNALAIQLSVSSLMENGHWPKFESMIRERREQWISDSRDPRIYQSHAELVHVNARVAECDWLLDLFSECRPNKEEQSQ